MIVSNDSPLRRLPSQLNHKQTLFLDGIRYSIEMADLAHSRLQRTLCALTFDRDSSENHHLDFISSVLDAWSIVDSVHRLRALLRQAPGIKQKSSGLRIFLRRTAHIKDLRNSVQHLNRQIDAMVNQRLPVWGLLSWVAIDPHGGTGCCCSLIPGTLFPSKGHPLVNPAGKNILVPIDLITLKASGHSVCLSDVMKAVQLLARSAEQELTEQFKNLPRPGADLLICLRVAFSDAKSDESK